MKTSFKIGSAVLAFGAFALPIVTSTSFDTARDNGMSYAPAVVAASAAAWGGVVAFLASPWVFIPVVIVAAVSLTYFVTTRFNRFNGGKNWWAGVQRVTIRRAACALADNLPEERFDQSPRAKALAEELLSLVNHGHMPLADERINIGAAIRASTDQLHGPFGKKDRTCNAFISVKTLNDFARGRRLKLPWPVPPKENKA